MPAAPGSDGTPRGPEGDGPVFLVGWWRSGTTFFWNLLRQDDRYTCYYEPLHEHLPARLDEAAEHGGDGQDDGIDDRDGGAAGARAGPVDPTHLAVDGYWTEYRHVDRTALDDAWRPWFGRERWVLGPDDEAPELRRHLELLVEAAPARPVLKVVRASLRAAWLRRAFADATLVHVVRDPRSVWTSMVGRDAAGDDPLPAKRHGFFHALLRVAEDLGVRHDAHLYRTFFDVWLRAFRATEAVCDRTWWYGDAVGDPDAWMDAHLVDDGWLDAPPGVPVHAGSLAAGLHPPSWYRAHELAVLEADGASLPGGTDGPDGPEGPDGPDDPRVAFLLEENRHLDDELTEMAAALRRLERRYELLLHAPGYGPLARLWRRLRGTGRAKP